MTEHITYSCDFCGASYGTSAEAAACEKNHHRSTGTGAMIYSGPASEYPDIIRVDFETGVSRNYTLSQGYHFLPQQTKP